MSFAVLGHATGVVADFDDDRGYGTVTLDDGGDVALHCTAIADGTRTIDPGTRVRVELAAGRGGRLEAWNVRAVA